MLVINVCSAKSPT